MNFHPKMLQMNVAIQDLHVCGYVLFISLMIALMIPYSFNLELQTQKSPCIKFFNVEY